jgi:hypothetical protein
MLKSDIIIETSSNIFEFLNSDSESITINYIDSPDLKFKSVSMAKVTIIEMINEFIDKPTREWHSAKFNPNVDEKDLTNHL